MSSNTKLFCTYNVSKGWVHSHKNYEEEATLASGLGVSEGDKPLDEDEGMGGVVALGALKELLFEDPLSLVRAAFHRDNAIVQIIVPTAEANTRFCKGITL